MDDYYFDKYGSLEKPAGTNSEVAAAHGPSPPQKPETRCASSEQPPTHQLPSGSTDQSRPSGDLPRGSRNIRSQDQNQNQNDSQSQSQSQTVAHRRGVLEKGSGVHRITTSAAGAPIKRKPLSASASPVARRYSESLSQQLQQQSGTQSRSRAQSQSPASPSLPLPSPPPSPQQPQAQSQYQSQWQTPPGSGSSGSSGGHQFYLDIILDELPMPDQRFSRSFSVDSPTIYEFPGGQGMLASSSSSSSSSVTPQPLVSQSGPPPPPAPATANQGTDAGEATSRNIPDASRANPAGLQTQPEAAALSEHRSSPSLSSDPDEQTVTHVIRSPIQRAAVPPSPGSPSSDTSSNYLPYDPPNHLESDSEGHLEGHLGVLEGDQIFVAPAVHSKPDVNLSSINTWGGEAMSLFARKPAPPHLHLGPIAGHDTHEQHLNLRTAAPSFPTPATATATTTTTTTSTPRTTGSPTAQADEAGNTNRNTATTITTSITTKPLPPPKSPVSSRLGTFFGWSNASPSSATEFSDKGYSPLPSPFSPKASTTVFTNDTPISAATTSTPVFIAGKSSHAGTADQNPLGYCEDYLQTPPAATPLQTVQIEDMEDELKAIGAELASSIRREMDLEDLVDRLQSEINNPQAPGKRTSDYFSDSGYSSAKFSEYDAGKEEIAQIQRRAEQEKAQVHLELSQKLQDERSRRRDLDQQIKELSLRASQVGQEAQRAGSDATGRVRELEQTCEDLRRRLSEERQVKDNFEDLLSALKGELQSASNERDNLRDEVVPQLRARVEGLEVQASEHSKLTYESTKIQQELQSLKKENAILKVSSSSSSSSKLQQPLWEEQERDKENVPTTRLARSSSLSVKSPTPSFRLQSAPLGRSNTVRGPPKARQPTQLHAPSQGQPAESREAMSERLRDVEAQRDALHNALKNLLERQEFQNRESEKRLRMVEQERDRLLASSPKKAGYEREVSSLRDEISVLRRRAEEALEQKWQVEKGLSGLKMDLDRAEEEIAGLRSLLREKDILIPAALSRSSTSSSLSNNPTLALPVSSASLEKAYKELQEAYTEALDRIKNLAPGATEDEKTAQAIGRLERSLTTTMAVQSQAAMHSAFSSSSSSRSSNHSSEVDSYRERAESLEKTVRTYLDTERDLASQLSDSARRVEELAAQVQAQLTTNAMLRGRLTEAVARGEADQRANKDRIAGMQTRLTVMERELVAAQTAAEERVARHEDELRSMRDAHSAQLQRLRDGTGGLRSPRVFPPKSPLSPMFALTSAPRSPRLMLKPAAAAGSRPGSSGSATSGSGLRPSPRRSSTLPPGDVREAAKVDELRARVRELESALNTADSEMQEVVGRMNTAQIEVLQLQEERENAVRETRRLQRQLESEKVKAFEDRFRTLSSNVTAS